MGPVLFLLLTYVTYDMLGISKALISCRHTFFNLSYYLLASLQLNSSLRSIPMQLLLANVVAGKQYFLPTFQNSNLASVKSTEYCPAGGGRVFVGGFALIKKLSSIDLWKLLARPEVSTPLHSATPQPLCLPRPALPSISPKNILAFLQRIFSPFSKESFSISLQRS